MSVAGPMKNFSASTTRSAFAVLITILASSTTSAGAVSDGQTRAVVPAARVLGDVAADGGCIADLRACHPAGRIGKHLELFADHFALRDVCECRERADFDAVGGLADT